MDSGDNLLVFFTRNGLGALCGFFVSFFVEFVEEEGDTEGILQSLKTGLLLPQGTFHVPARLHKNWQTAMAFICGKSDFLD